MRAVCNATWYPKINAGHFSWTASSINKMTGLCRKFVLNTCMTYAHRRRWEIVFFCRHLSSEVESALHRPETNWSQKRIVRSECCFQGFSAWPEICDRFMIWPRPAYANPQLLRTSPTSRTSTCTHRQLSSCSWAVKKRNQEFLFQEVDLEVTFGIFFPSNPRDLRATSFFVCLRRLCLRRSPGVTQVLRLSLCVTHTLPLPSQIRAVSTFLFVWFVSKRVRESRGFVESKHELQRYWINNKLSSLTIDTSTCMAIRKDSDWSEKSFPRQTNFENISLSRKRGILLG